jgi:tetratricopeptide (TPR) repeat protein
MLRQNRFHSARDLEDILGVDQQCRIAQNFRKRGCVGGQNRGAVRHGFQGGQAKTLVKGREGEQRRGLIKNPQNRVGHKTEETHVLLHSTAHDCQAQILMPAQFVADDDQFQVSVVFMPDQLVLQHGKRFDKPVHVLVRADPARVEYERIVQLIALENLAPVLAAGIACETLVQSVMNDRNAVRIQVEDVDEVIPGGIRNGNHAAGGFDGPFRAQVDLVTAETREAFERKLHMDAIVNRDDTLPGRYEKALVMRNMNHVQALPAQLEGKGEMFAPAFCGGFSEKRTEVGAQLAEFLEIGARTEKEIFIARVHFRKVSHEVPDVCPHAKFINAANVDCNAHESSRRNYNEKRMSRIFAALFVLLAAIVAVPSALFAQQTTVLVNAFENQTSDRNLDWIGEGLSLLIAERLTAQPRLYVFGLDERMAEHERLAIPDTVSFSRATALKIAWDMGADIVITGRISGTHDDFLIEAKVLDLTGGNSDFDVNSAGKLNDVISMAASLSSQLAKGLVVGAEPPESDYAARPPIPRSAFEAYVRGVLSADPQRRVELLKDAIRLHPQYSAAIYQLGQAYYLDSNYKTSSDLLEKISAAAPEYPQARFMLGMNYYHLGDFTRAAAAFSSLPPTYDVLVDLGAAQAGKGDAAAAEATWRRALTAKTTGAEASFNLAYVAFSRGDSDTAANRLTQFLRSHGRDAEALFLLGQVYERLGRTADSRRVVAQATRLSPRLEKWVGQPIPNIARLRTQYNATELRMPFETTIWNEARLARKSAAQDAGDILTGRRRP